MLVEAIDTPMCYRWPEGEVQLVPGQPVDLPESRALRLLHKAHGKVRMVSGSSILAMPVRSGSWVTWLDPDGRERSGLVDYIHTYPDELWAFCTLPEGRWTAVNVKYILKREHGDDGERQANAGL